MYIYIYIYNLPPPLIRHAPNKKPPLGGTNIVTINLDGGTITPLIRNPPSEANIVTINLDGGTINLDGGWGGFLLGRVGGFLIRGGEITYMYVCIYV